MVKSAPSDLNHAQSHPTLSAQNLVSQPAGAPVRASLRAIAIVLAITITVLTAVGGIRWAKRHSTGAQLLASAMIMVLGVGVPIVNPPQQGIEEAREDKG